MKKHHNLKGSHLVPLPETVQPDKERKEVVNLVETLTGKLLTSFEQYVEKHKGKLAGIDVVLDESNWSTS